MHGVYLKYRGNKKQQHPLVEHILEIYYIVSEHLLHESVCIVNHEDAGQDEEYVCRRHYFLE